MKKSIVLVLLIFAVTFLSLTMLFNPSGAQQWINHWFESPGASPQNKAD